MTTASFPVLQSYGLGSDRRRRETTASVGLFRRVIDIVPNFAIAHVALDRGLSGRRRRDPSQEAYQDFAALSQGAANLPELAQAKQNSRR